jgi:hypothetical protein
MPVEKDPSIKGFDWASFKEDLFGNMRYFVSESDEDHFASAFKSFMGRGDKISAEGVSSDRPYATSYMVGSYATAPTATPWDRVREAEFYEGLRGMKAVRGIEVQLYADGKMHPEDEDWFLQQLKPDWDCVLTIVGGTMVTLGTDQNFGLASDNEEGRAAAIEYARVALKAVGRLNQVREGCVIAVELQSAPNRATAISSSASLARSLSELRSWDWSGAQLVIEHCDAFVSTHAPNKGFLTLEEEISAIKTAQRSSREGAELGCCINWARSVLETRSTATAVLHIEKAKEAGLLKGLMFSGCTGTEGPYGPWIDNHMPHSQEDGTEFYATGSLLSETQIRNCLSAARSPSGGTDLLYCGCKITAHHDTTGANVAMRVGLNRDLLSLIGRAKPRSRL